MSDSAGSEISGQPPATRGKKEFIRGKLAGFQTKIYELNRGLREQEQVFRSREEELLGRIMSVLDVMDGLEEEIAAVKAGSAGPVPRWVVILGSIQKRLQGLLESRHVFPIEFPEHKASLNCCKVVETREAGHMEDETILTVVKKGYLNRRENRVLRKAEVVTVRNHA
ncbi:MAG: nucleotide exchange factor GrpE [Elusimicrobia bacterium]|nr:nucleotide exchange factor GrpE [Elusimicrobiota bacterium]